MTEFVTKGLNDLLLSISLWFCIGEITFGGHLPPNERVKRRGSQALRD